MSNDLIGIALAVPVPAIIASAVVLRPPAIITICLLLAAGAVLFSLQWIQLWLGDLAGFWPRL